MRAMRSASSAMRSDKLRDGATLMRVPRRHAQQGRARGPFKGGAFQVAIEAGVPVVPVAISGSGAVLPPSGFRVRPGHDRVRIGDADRDGRDDRAGAQCAGTAGPGSRGADAVAAGNPARRLT
jgi:hypothetical protein